ncbi:cell division protein FtsQ/DivIB [Caulobacter sp. 17J65-9]|uniref:cell division protein FtsQ/DivIB n=1 Tax=Caulobacter sp. 17J65-9 TaxID=2709382 RepID=UPI0013CAB7E5|nr:cell division protein FtsQ/DivIB [Caulobacter sp. 17J65-9]NEX92570.1 cell division protein FtsQ/DivIB [Caulobacter sp. 17J65-9]
MPAVVRGGRKQAPTPKKAGKTTSRSARPAPRGGRQPHADGGRVPPKLGIAVALGVVVLGITLTMATGGRAQAFSAAVGQGVDNQLAAMGFKLKAVHIKGASPEALPYVQRALNLRRGQPLARLDLAEVQGRVKAVGWVKDAKVVRLLPDTLVISITERERLAVWQHEGRAAVIDAEGQVIPEADPGRFPDLPLVVGDGADITAGEILPLVVQRPRLLGRLEALVRVDTRRWDLRLKDGSLIQLPAVDEESALIQLDQLDQRSRVLELGFARIDLRDPEMIAVRPRDGRQVVSPAAGGA